MTKNIGNYAAVNTEVVINSELLFNDDALVVDYLNALLISSPGMNLHSGEINSAPLTLGAEWKSFGVTNSTIDTAMFFDFSKMDADRLRNENENLKLKFELLKIDAQVLRSENNNLKLEVAGMKTQVHDMKSTLDTAMIENNALKTRTDSLKAKLKTVAKSSQPPTPHVHAVSARSLEKAVQKRIESDSKHAVSDECVDNVTVQKEDIIVPLAVQQNTMPCEITQEVSPGPVIVEQTQRADEKTCSGIDQDTAIISRINVVEERSIQRVDQDTVKLFRKRVGTDTSIQYSKPVSKIIKQHNSRKDQSHFETTQALNTTSPEPVRDDKSSKAPDWKPIIVQEQHCVKSDTRQEDNAVSNINTLRLDDAEEVELEAVPAPKVVVKRNVKNYEELQNNANAIDATITGHNVIL